jgi:tRNA A37 threonylcarbamoyladenosine dehydratase
MSSARLTVVGAGNVGFWTVCALALTLKHAGAAGAVEVHVVDFASG